MLDALYTKPFRAQYKLLKRRGMDMGRLTDVMEMIINETPLPPKQCNHPLSGKWKGSFDCHFHGDWVLICKLNHENRTVTFQATGNHSDLDL